MVANISRGVEVPTCIRTKEANYSFVRNIKYVAIVVIIYICNDISVSLCKKKVIRPGSISWLELPKEHSIMLGSFKNLSS